MTELLTIASLMSHPISSAKFQVTSNEHRACLVQRGYAHIIQSCLDNHLVRNAPWKTYWRADHPELGDVFIKINYGYDAKTNTWMGEKEAKLPAYFSTFFQNMPNIAFPHVLDNWNMGSAYVVVFENVLITNQSLYSLITTSKYRELFIGMLKIWSAIQPPTWWNEKYVLHDFALHNDLPMASKDLSPFGFDLDDNLGVDGSGRLFVYDFEFIQWSSRGLQQLFLIHKLFKSRRQVLNTLQGRGLARIFHTPVACQAFVISNLT